MKRILLIITLVLLLTNKGFSQAVITSPVYIQTCFQKTNCFAVSQLGYLFYDESSNEIIFKLDLTRSKTGKDTLDDWMDDLKGTNLYFVAQIKKEELLAIAINNSKTIHVSGSLYFNDTKQDITSDITAFRSAEGNQIKQQRIVENVLENYTLNFGISFSPKDFKIHKRPHHLKKEINLGVAFGSINVLKPEFQNLINELKR